MEQAIVGRGGSAERTSVRTLITLATYSSLGGALALWAIGQGWAALWLATLSLASLFTLPLLRGSASRTIPIATGYLVLPIVVVFAAVMVVTSPGIYVAMATPGNREQFSALAAAVGAIAIVSALLPRLPQWATVPLLLLTMGVAGGWIIWRSPDPQIDLFSHHQLSCEAVLNGQNPYAMTFPDIYGPGSPYTNAEMVRNGRTTYGFAYPPTMLYVSLPSYLLFGDYRYGYLACLLIGAGFLSQCASRWHGMVAAVLLLLAPRMFHVLESGWTEMPLFAALGIFVYLSSRNSRWAVIPLAAMLASKQYMVAAAPLLLLVLPRPLELRSSVRFLALAGLTALAIHGPWFAIDPEAYFHSLVRAHTMTVFRADSMSWMSALGRNGEAPWPNNVGLVVSILVALIFAKWGRPDVFGFCTGLAATLLAFFLLTRGFTNYFVMAIGLVAAAMAVVGPLAKRAPHPVVQNE